MADEKAKSAAPYLPFKTFISSLDPFSQGVPPRVDRSIWSRSQSGLMQGLIMNAYRFLGLINDQDQPTVTLAKLVKKETQKKEVAEMLRLSYPDVFKHDLMTLTPKILDEELEKCGVGGETKKKAATFLLQAAKFSDIPLSNFLTERIRNTSVRRKKTVRKPDGNGENTFIPTIPLQSFSGGSTESVTLENGGTVTLHIAVELVKLRGKDRTFVFELIDKIQTYKDEIESTDEE
jgi:hypothetical protein